MDKEYLELAKLEFDKERQFWRNAIFTRGSFYVDLMTRVSDRQINHILILSSISPAILAIIFPLVDRSSNSLLIIAFSLLFISTILGASLVLYTIFKDQNGIPKTKEWEIGIYKKFLSRANQNYSKAYSGDITKQDIETYFSGDIISEESEKTQKEQIDKFQKAFINLWYITFLATFFVGLLTFSASFICKV